MGKGGKGRAPAWQGVLRGAAAALALYLGGTALLTLLMVKGAVPENLGFPVLTVLCAVSALCGGLLTDSALPPLSGALAVSAGFDAVLAAVGLGCWQGITWIGQGGALLFSGFMGGLLAALVKGRRKKRRRKGKRAL